MPAARLAPMFPEQGPGGEIEKPDVEVVPLHSDLATEPAGRGRVVGASHFDAAVEMHGALAVLVVAEGLERQREQVGAFLGEDNLSGGYIDFWAERCDVSSVR